MKGHTVVDLPRADGRASAARTPGTQRASGVDGGLQSVLSALDVLDLFTGSEDLGVSQVARHLGVAKSTAHRLLTTLCARRLAEKDEETGRYRLGLHLFELGQLAVERNALRRRAVPLLHDLQRLSGATVHLAVPDGSEVVYLERLVASGATREMHSVGRRLPSHCTGSGKVIAAFTPTLASARRSAGFSVKMTDHSIRSAAQYAQALTEVRRTGFALNVDEAVDGMASVAAPVVGSDGSARAAISLVVPTRRMLEDLGRPVQLVQQAARSLARDLCL
jgi:DNA-binding IclR family transcriptional regulator